MSTPKKIKFHGATYVRAEKESWFVQIKDIDNTDHDKAVAIHKTMAIYADDSNGEDLGWATWEYPSSLEAAFRFDTKEDAASFADELDFILDRAGALGAEASYHTYQQTDNYDPFAPSAHMTAD